MNKTNKLNKITKKLSPSSAKKRKKKGKKKQSRPLPRKETLVSLGILLVLAVFLLILLLDKEEKNVETGASVPPGEFSFCIDISHHNGTEIIWDSLKVMTDREGRTVRSIGKAVRIRPVDAVYIKASEGESLQDPQFARNWEEAGQRSLRRGAYHFFSPGRNPEKQARNFIRTVGALRFSDLPPVLDIETLPINVSREQLNKNAAVWLQTVESHYGIKPVIYAPDSYIRDILSSELTGKYPLWVAHYEVDSPLCETYRMWQFTDKAVIYGIPGRTDLSIIQNNHSR